MEQNSGRIDPTPRPARSPPASFSRAPVVPAPGRTGKLGHLIRLSRPHAGLGASPLPSRSTANPRSRARTCWPKRSPPTSGCLTRARVGRTPQPQDARTAEVPEQGPHPSGVFHRQPQTTKQNRDTAPTTEYPNRPGANPLRSRHRRWPNRIPLTAVPEEWAPRPAYPPSPPK